MKHAKKNNKKNTLIIVLLVLLAFIVIRITLSKYISTIGNLIVLNIREPIYYVYYHDGNELIGTQEFKYGTSERLNRNTRTKSGYSFTGWNTQSDGSGTDYADEQLVLNLSSTDEDIINLYAMWEQDSGTPYTVIHQKMDLDGINYTTAETETLYGEVNEIVGPATKNYEGFTSPQRQFVRINEDGSTEVTYRYARKKFTLVLENIDLIDTSLSTSAGEHYYDTPITIVWLGHTGCTFIKWSNNDTTTTTQFLLKQDTTIKPIFDFTTVIFQQYDGYTDLIGVTVTKADILSFSRNMTLTRAEVLAKPGVTRIDNTVNDGYLSENEAYGWVEDNNFYWWSEAYLAYFHPSTVNAFEEYASIVTIDLTGTSTELVRNFANWFNKDKLLKNIVGRINTNGVQLEYNNNHNYRSDSNDTKTNVGMSFMFNDCNALQSIDLSEFNTSNVTDMKRMFGGCRSIKSLDVSTFDTSRVVSFYWMFRANENLLSIDVSNFDSSNVVNMFGMFVQAQKIKTITFGPNFNTSNVVNMENMFYQNKQLKTIYVAQNFNLTNVSRSSNMFYQCSNLIGEEGESYQTNFDSTKTNKEYARIAEPNVPGYFTYVGAKVTYTITYILNGGLASNPDTYREATPSFTLTAPTKTGYTFLGWTGSNGDTPQTEVTIAQGSTGDKEYCANFIANTYTIVFDANGGEGSMNNQILTYDTAQSLRTNTYTMDGYTFLRWTTNADGTGTRYSNNQTVINLATSGSITLYAQYISNERLIAYFKSYDGSIDGLLGFTKTNITSFQRNDQLTLDQVQAKSGVTLISNTQDDGFLSPTEVYGWVENNNFYWWSEAELVYFHPDTLKAFDNCQKMLTINLTGTSTEKVKNFAKWFNKNLLLTQIIGKVDTSGLELQYNNNFDYIGYAEANNDECSDVGLAFMFNDCKVLTAIDLSEFDTRNATDMKRMFGGCKALTTIDVSGFDTRNVRSFYWMFRQNENLTQIDLSNFDTRNVVNMFGMFVFAKKLQTVTLGANFDTSNVVSMGNVFYGNSKLTTIYAVRDFDLTSVTNSSNMFKDCSLLVGAAGESYQTVFSTSKTNAEYARIAIQGRPGYFTQR